MAKPLIIAVESNANALREVQAQLSQRYGGDYEVTAFDDSDEALTAAAELADTEAEVALALVGEAESGGPLLDRIRLLHPQAKRALLAAPGGWSIPATAELIRSLMALGRIDHYVLLPTGSPDEVFHEAVSSFLLEWARERRRVPQTVHIVGEEWSGRAYELRSVFERCSVPHAFWLAGSEKGRDLLAKAGPESPLPLMVLPDGTVLCDPSDAEIAEVAGVPDLEADRFDVVIVGAGPAGLSAAVYSASEGLRTLVVDEGGIGGQARSSSLIRNYLGFAKGISGSRLAEQAYEQARSFGADFAFLHRATDLRRTEHALELTLTNDRVVTAGAVILATGATYKRLDIPTLDGLTGAGVFYGSPGSEVAGLRGKDVYIVGGGNSGGQAAMHLAKYARRVTLLVRGPTLASSMSHYLVKAIEAAAKIDVRTDTIIVGGGGDGGLERLTLRDTRTEAESTVPADALFVMIGARPHTEWLPAEVARDEHGFLLTDDDLPETAWPLERRPLPLETSMPGVFAAGDVRLDSMKRVASAVGEGAVAAKLLHPLLDEAREASELVAPGRT